MEEQTTTRSCLTMGKERERSTSRKIFFSGTHVAVSGYPALDGKALRIVGLFAGIGGFELGLSRAGHETLWLCEIDPAAREVLKARFGGVGLLEDVRSINSLPGDADLVTAGFPCQDLSQVGKAVGIKGVNSGLINEVLRLLGNRRVPWLLLENVPFMLSLGGGKALIYITGKLQELGYNWAYRVVDSQAFGLPQRRRRVFLLASSEADPRRVLFADFVDSGQSLAQERDNSSFGFYWTEGNRGLGWAKDAVPTLKGGSAIGIPSPPAIWLPDGRIVKPDVRDAERMQGFDIDWTLPAQEFTKKQGVRWRLIGNSVTVDVAHWIGERLLRPGAYDENLDAPFNLSKGWPLAAYKLIDSPLMRCAISDWPVAMSRGPLIEFLSYPPVPLSAAAASGFLKRFKASTLRKPPGFVEALEVHVKKYGVK